MKTKEIIVVALMLCLIIAGCGRERGIQAQDTQTERRISIIMKKIRKLSTLLVMFGMIFGLAIRGNDCQNNQDSVRSEVNDWLLELGF